MEISTYITHGMGLFNKNDALAKNQLFIHTYTHLYIYLV